MNFTTSSTQYDGSGGGVPSVATPSANIPANVVATQTSVLNFSTTTLAPKRKINYLSPTPNSTPPTKRVICKITPIDPKQLQLLDCNREIAAAIIKQKKSTQVTASCSKPARLTTNISQHKTTAPSTIVTTEGASSKTPPSVIVQQQLESPTTGKPYTYEINNV